MVCFSRLCRSHLFRTLVCLRERRCRRSDGVGSSRESLQAYLQVAVNWWSRCVDQRRLQRYRVLNELVDATVFVMWKIARTGFSRKGRPGSSPLSLLRSRTLVREAQLHPSDPQIIFFDC
jgi:hypothetical protein